MLKPNHEDVLTAEDIKKKKFAEDYEKHFEKLKPVEFQRRSKNLQEKTRLTGFWDPTEIPTSKISDEYSNYDVYMKNYAYLDNVAMNPDDDGKLHIGSNIEKMKREQDKFEIDDVVTKRSPEDNSDSEIESGVSDGEELLQNASKEQAEEESDLEETEIDGGRLSPTAKEEIYRRFLAGWTVRDLCLQYGIIPERVQAVVWQRRYFYEEILPKASLVDMELMKLMEMSYAMDFSYCDYGLDLDELNHREEGVPIINFNKTDVDVSAGVVDGDLSMEQLKKSKQKRKYDIVTEKFHGYGTKGFYVKSWIVSKGRGSLKVSRMFKAAVQRSNGAKHRLPDKVAWKLKKGPRVASLGHGIK